MARRVKDRFSTAEKHVENCCIDANHIFVRLKQRSPNIVPLEWRQGPRKNFRAWERCPIRFATSANSGRFRRGFSVRHVLAAEADQWSVIDGSLQHKSRGFFSVNALSNGDESYVLLYQPQGAVTGLMSSIVDNERWFLLQARAEPGC